MKNIFKSTLPIALAIVLTGCGTAVKRASIDNTVTDEPVTEGTLTDEPVNKAKTVENLTQGPNQPEDSVPEIPKITAAVQRWDKDTIYDIIGEGQPFSSEEEYPSDRYPDEMRTVWFYDERYAYLHAEPESVGYHAPDNGAGHRYFFSCHDLYYSEPTVTYSDELEGFSKEDAIQRAREAAEKLGITNIGEPSVFAITAESANAHYRYEKRLHELSENMGDYEYVPWTKDDEAYYLTFPLVYEGIPVETSGVAVKGYSFDGSFVKVIVTKDEIVDLDCWGITTPEYEIGEPVKINFSAEDILNKVASEPPKNVVFDKMEYYNCELVYAPVDKPDNNEWVFAPVWRLDYGITREYDSIVYNKPLEWEVHYTAIYNAETGERIAFGWE